MLTGFRQDSSSAGRDIDVSLVVHGEDALVHVREGQFRHRSWTHVCWIYLGRNNGTSWLYFNGQLVSSESYPAGPAGAPFPSLPGSEAMQESVFLLGQESDKIGGGFSVKQVFQLMLHVDIYICICHIYIYIHYIYDMLTC